MIDTSVTMETIENQVIFTVTTGSDEENNAHAEMLASFLAQGLDVLARASGGEILSEEEGS